MPENEEPDWKWLAVHALHDLRLLGVDIAKMNKVTPEVIEQVDIHSRNMQAYS